MSKLIQWAMRLFKSNEPVYSVKQVRQIEPIAHDYWLISVIYCNQILSFSTTLRNVNAFCRLVNSAIMKQLGSKYKHVRPFLFNVDNNTNSITYLIDNLYDKSITDAIFIALLNHIEDDAKEYLKDTITFKTMTKEITAEIAKARTTEFVPTDFYIDVVHEGVILNRYSVHFTPNENKIKCFNFLLHCLYCEEEGVSSKSQIRAFRIEARYHDHIMNVANQSKSLVLSHDHFGHADPHGVFGRPVRVDQDFVIPEFNIKQCRNGDFIYATGGDHV